MFQAHLGILLTGIIIGHLEDVLPYLDSVEYRPHKRYPVDGTRMRLERVAAPSPCRWIPLSPVEDYCGCRKGNALCQPSTGFALQQCSFSMTHQTRLSQATASCQTIRASHYLRADRCLTHRQTAATLPQLVGSLTQVDKVLCPWSFLAS